MPRRPLYKVGDRVKVLAITRTVNGREIVDVPSFIGIVKSRCRFGLYFKVAPASGRGGAMTLPPTMIVGRVLPNGRIEKPKH